MSKLKNLFGFRDKSKSELQKEEHEKSALNSGIAFGVADVAKDHAENAAKTFAKPLKYDRKILDKKPIVDANGNTKKINVKETAKKEFFGDNLKVKDPYSDNDLVMRRADAKAMFGSDNYADHIAETDHIVPEKRYYDQTKDNPWITNDDAARIVNDDENLAVTSRKINNAKRSRTNEEFVNDSDYLETKGIELSDEGKQRMLDDGKKASSFLNKETKKTAVKNFVKTGHNAGLDGAKYGAAIGGGISGIKNLVAVIKGEKDGGEALYDTAADTAKSSVTGYASSFLGANVRHSFSLSSNTMVKTLSNSNLPSMLVAVGIETITSSKKFICGEIDGTEYLTELGEKGTGVLASSVGATVGQLAIPIPIVGGLIGGMVGYAFSSSYYNELVTIMQNRKLAYEERIRIEAECQEAIAEMRRYRAEIEQISEAYFADYKNVFSTAFATIEESLISGNADGVIMGSNMITKKLGGTVQYNNMEEFDSFMNDLDSDFIL